MKIFKKLFCTHDYKLECTCTYGNQYERYIKIEVCKKCSKIKKSIV